MAHIVEYKTRVVDEFTKLIKEYPIVGAINMENMPSPQLQVMRATLRDTVVMKMSKRRLMRIAIEKAKKNKPGIEKIEEYLKGMPAMIFTKENPFKLYSKLKKSKSSAPAKAGQTAPKDIIINAGPTQFSPGPVISELGACGLKTGVENGKVAIKEDAVVVKEGDEIKANVASVLTRLGIEPMEVGLDLVAVYEDGVIYTKDILDIDEDKFKQDLQNAATWALNLAVETGYPTKDSIELMLGKAFNDAKGLAVEQEIMCDTTAELLLSKAEAQAKSLAGEANIDLTKKEAPKPEVKPAEKAEEKKQEQPKEKAKPEAEQKPEAKEEVKEAPKDEVKKEEKVPDSQKQEGGN